MAKTRTFIGVEAVDAVHSAALAAMDQLRGAAGDVKWVEPDNLHWTLQFLGDLTDVEMAEVCMRTVRTAAEHESFELRGRGVGAFPSIARPRTLWLGAGEGGAEMIALQAAIEASLWSLGFRGENRPYTPHLTLGRGGRGGGGRELTAQLETLSDFDGGVMSVDRVMVFASELTREGPAYQVLATARLG